MKKLFLFVFILFASAVLNAQVQKYHRVLIQVSPEKKQYLLSLGITIDHSHTGPDGIVAEISEYEIELLKANAIPYQIQIKDMANYYAERNKSESLQKSSVPLNCIPNTIPVPSHFHLGSMGGYFTFQEMENILDSMALLYPNLISVKQPISSTQSIEGRNIWYVRISDNPNVDENEPEVLYTSLHHAREPQSLSQLIFYMWYLLENYSTSPEIIHTLADRELYFIPCVNPDGYVYNETNSPGGGGMWRKNRRLNSDGTYGVDLNRNYGHDWGYDNIGSSPTPSTDVYRGTAGFSEPETQAMESFCNAHQFKNALNAHTFGNDFIYPWGHIPSSYTPDNTTFQAWGEYLTREHRYVYGTCNETLGYLTNGDSDDWMYGEQTSKPKIMAMTPETGTYNDGFWPASNRIIDICKTTVQQNFRLARLAGSCLVAYDLTDKFIGSNGYIKYKVKELGLSPGSNTVSVIPNGGISISSSLPPKVYTNLTTNQELIDSIPYTLSSGIPGSNFYYYLGVSDASGLWSEQVNKIYGTPTTVFYDNGNSTTTNFDLSGTWGTSTSTFVSAPSCITDSPLGDYISDEHKTITTKGQLDLTNVTAAHLEYYTKFQIEKTFDQVTIEVSTNNGASYAPLCGMYETPLATFGGLEPVYDGRQDNWVKEDIDLFYYIGSKIKLRFKFDSDFYDERDGFYFDDFLVRIIPQNTVGMEKNIKTSDLSVFPNPSSGIFKITGQNLNAEQIDIYNSLGQSISCDLTRETNSELRVDLHTSPAGLYFIRIRSNGQEILKKLVLEPR